MATTETTAATATDDPQIPLDHRRVRSASPGATRARASTRTTRSSGRCATPSSPARTGPPSSSARSSSRSSGRRPRRTSSRRSTSADRSAPPQRERSVRQMIDRVADTITDWGRKDGYFADADEADAFHAELKYLLVNQHAAFNSPVWFNVGVEERPQARACFILAVDDSMDAILNWIARRAASSRAARARASTSRACAPPRSSSRRAATPPGPVTFMRGADASAGTIKSGGKTRRAAKMVILDVDHPDIEEFIWCKSREEEKARALQDAGYDMALDSPDWPSIQYQNANNSVRLTDEFMRAVEADRDWNLTARTTGEVVKTVRARDLMRQIAEAAWRCADPGMQFDTTINDWHTCPNTGRINASNPCSEYMHVDNSACNLASLNLMRFRRRRRRVRRRRLQARRRRRLHGAGDPRLQLVYPTEQIGENAHKMRQLGLGYANLGALLMARGLPYDSDEGRAYAAAITALMTGRAYRKSAEIAARMGPFVGVRAQPPADGARDGEAPRRGRQHRGSRDDRRRPRRRRPRRLGRGARAGSRARLPQRAGHGARAHRDDLVPDGLRHDRRRARLLARQDQAPRRRRRAHDRQRHRAAGAPGARLQRRPRARRSSPTSPTATRSSARRRSSPSTWRCSTARWAIARSTTTATSR